jgi:hypothetical protein
MFIDKGIFWLSSYPKSGNTWFRIVLAHLINQSHSLNYINTIDSILGSSMVANREWMNKALGYDSIALPDDEIDSLRPGAYKAYAQHIKKTTYIKIHDAYTYVDNKTPLFPAQGCLGALYFVRNPLDVAISMAHYVKCPIDWSIHMMGNKDFVIPLEGGNAKQLRQKLLSWSQHVESWRKVSTFNTLIVRYEDMFFNPQDTFTKALRFLNLDFSQEAIAQAIDASSFEKLQHHEKNVGFKEKLSPDSSFFRKGIVGDWKETLNEAQIQKIIHDHGDVMRLYGYLDDNNQPV